MCGHQAHLGSWSGRISRRYNGMAEGWSQSIHWVGINTFIGLLAPAKLSGE
jgi:hypothetical protein